MLVLRAKTEGLPRGKALRDRARFGCNAEPAPTGRELVFGELLSEYESRPAFKARSFRSTIAPLREALGAKLTHQIAPEDLFGFALDLVSAGAAPKTVHKHLDLAAAILEYAKRTGAAPANAARGVPRDQLPRRANLDPELGAREVLSPAEATRLFYDQRIPIWRRCYYALQWGTGARGQEAAAGKMSDLLELEPLRGYRIAWQWDSRAGEMRPPKGGEIRTAPVPVWLEDLLDELGVWFYRRFERPRTAEDPICPVPRLSKQPGPEYAPALWAESTAIRNFKADLKTLGLSPRRRHGLRHSYVSNLLRLGADSLLIRGITHARPKGRDPFLAYAHFDWPSLCGAVSLLKTDDAVFRELTSGQMELL